MQAKDVQQLIEQKMPGATVTVEGGGAKFHAVVISDSFEGKLPVARQREVYAILKSYIETNEIHALTIKARTTHEYTQDKNEQNG